MKTRYLLILFMGVMLLVNACSPLTIVSSTGEQPTPVEISDPAPAGYQPVTVDDVKVEVGIGSPIPVHVIVSGNLPDVCSQVEHTEIRQDGSNFIVNLSATPRVEGCLPDTLPFKMGIPLNVVDLPAGSYSVTVNGSRAEFQLDAGNSSATLRTADMPIVKNDIQVDAVSIDIGVGSPIPVHAIVSANLPNACAQLGEVRVHRDGTTFVVRLVAYVPAQTDCNPDTLPFRLEVPLNIVNLPEGPYQVNVNGVTASFDPRTTPVDPGEAIAERKLIPVEHVGFEVGVDSVDIVASGTWPDPCAQIAEVQSQVSGYQIDFTVLATTVDSCPPDQPVLPFRFAIPLNGAALQDGSYTIKVNGISNTFDWPPSR